MVSLRTVKDCVKTKHFLYQLQNRPYLRAIEAYAQEGVDALAAATPKDSGTTASSWYYEITPGLVNTTITWKNSNVTRDGDSIAIMLQYGHGTGTGGYVSGQDYINPAIRPIFDRIEDGVWEVIRGL